ncbi:MAG: hypothetical protein ACTHLK_23000 [Brucella intermedia]
MSKPTLPMPLDQARTLVANGCENWPRLVDAAATISYSPEATFADLLACLAHRGLPSEFGAMKLYLRTKRPRADDTIESFIMDRQDWTDYLKSRGLI